MKKLMVQLLAVSTVVIGMDRKEKEEASPASSDIWQPSYSGAPFYVLELPRTASAAAIKQHNPFVSSAEFIRVHSWPKMKPLPSFDLPTPTEKQITTFIVLHLQEKALHDMDCKERKGHEEPIIRNKAQLKKHDLPKLIIPESLNTPKIRRSQSWPAYKPPTSMYPTTPEEDEQLREFEQFFLQHKALNNIF